MKNAVYVAISVFFVLGMTLWIRNERAVARNMACVSSGESCSVTCDDNRACVSRCDQYSACSMNQDLTGAAGDVLDMYSREKNTDGLLYYDASVPRFQATQMSGEVVSSSSLGGKPTVLVFLASHCSHSYQTLPILQKLETKYGEDVRLVGVYVNTSSADDVKETTRDYKISYDLWAYPDDSIGDVIDSHLVPTFLFVDKNGKLKQKLVGFKTQAEVEERLEQNFAL